MTLAWDARTVIDTAPLAVYLAAQSRTIGRSLWCGASDDLPHPNECGQCEWPTPTLTPHMEGGHMFTARHWLPLLCGATLLACATDSSPTATRSPGFSAAQLLESESGPSASGHADVIQLPSGAKRTFSFHARVMPDGSVEGEYDNHNRQGGFVNHGDIDCLRFIGTNGAVMSGVAQRSTNPGAPPGSTAIFRVEDNGEGADDPADQVSQVAIFPPGSAANCQNTTPVILFPLVGGNIQVRP